MKTKTQKRLEAAARLDRRANEIARGEGWVWSTEEDRARACQKRRDEANRLRTLPARGDNS